MKRKERPTQDRVKELFHYDPETGLFTRRKATRVGPKSRKYGKVGAGRISELGYVLLMVDGINYIAGSLAWLYCHGEWPPARTKYIDGNPLNNRINNIRLHDIPTEEIRDRELTHERLKELLHYEPSTGWFTWRVPTAVSKPGERAGGSHGLGYRQMGLDYKKYLEHTLAWFYMTGEWPKSLIDHKNGDKADNSWANLRLATRSQNMYNKGVLRRSSTGVTGVNRHGNKYRTYLQNNGNQIYLGCFRTLAEARAAREAAERVFVGEFKHQNGSEPTAMYAMSEVNGPCASDAAPTDYGGH